MANKLILVTGATGYIASRLIPRLLERGYRVRALARDPLLLRGRSWYRHVELFSGDVLIPSTLPAVMQGVHSAYYLIHNMLFGRGYTAAELEGARIFSTAAKDAGVEHIIYLGGLADPQAHIAPHLRSRIETGRVLRQSRVAVTEFRAGAILGSGSISFEMIRFMTELFPVVPGPAWLRNKSQPIAIKDVIDYLDAALDNPKSRDRVFEIGGPQVITYADLMLRYARARGLKRGLMLFPFLPLWLMALGVGLMTPVPRPIAYALIGGLSNDSVVRDDSARHVFPEVKPIPIEQVTAESLGHLHPEHIEPVWDDGQPSAKGLKHEGFFIDKREIFVETKPENVFRLITNMGGANGWPYANWLWHLRGWMDRLVKGRSDGFSMRRRAGRKEVNNSSQPSSPGGSTLMVGDHLDFYRIEALEPDRLLRLHSELKAPGEGWMEWRLEPHAGGTRLMQTSYFAPRGLPGFLYWYLLYPFHALVFDGLIGAIALRVWIHK